jgi:hypothetical protein
MESSTLNGQTFSEKQRATFLRGVVISTGSVVFKNLHKLVTVIDHALLLASDDCVRLVLSMMTAQCQGSRIGEHRMVRAAQGRFHRWKAFMSYALVCGQEQHDEKS